MFLDEVPLGAVLVVQAYDQLVLAFLPFLLQCLSTYDIVIPFATLLSDAQGHLLFYKLPVLRAILSHMLLQDLVLLLRPGELLRHLVAHGQLQEAPVALDHRFQHVFAYLCPAVGMLARQLK